MHNLPTPAPGDDPARSATEPGKRPDNNDEVHAIHRDGANRADHAHETAAQPHVGPREVWATEEMRQACTRRDVAEVYQRLNAAGVSQRRLAAATGQSQSEVSEIMRRRRVVGDVSVLQRIADGLGVPRGWWGLAHTLPTDGSAMDAGAVSGGA